MSMPYPYLKPTTPEPTENYWEYIDADGDMPERDNHSNLIHYLIEILKYLYRVKGWYIHTNMYIKEDGYPDISADVALYKVVVSEAEREVLTSWWINPPGRPAPSVVFEIASEGTWPRDVSPDEKPLRYKRMGVKEYFTYDPNTPQVWRDKSSRLRGWRYDPAQPNLPDQELLPDARGWLFSEELNCWLKPDGRYLRLLAPNGQQHLTGEETERAQRKLERAQRKIERAEKEAERAQKEAERTARLQAEQQAQQAILREQALRAKLLARGIDPDSL